MDISKSLVEDEGMGNSLKEGNYDCRHVGESEISGCGKSINQDELEINKVLGKMTQKIASIRKMVLLNPNFNKESLETTNGKSTWEAMVDAENNNRMSGILEESRSFFPELITKRRRCGFEEVFASSGYNGEIGWFSFNRGRNFGVHWCDKFSSSEMWTLY
ncbi:hypothetical protein V6N13_017297 [Hibiscus sabdariffa]